ncbi:MAG: acyl-CoA thioesterase [Sphingobium sp.]|nr:acyl-CoA thioesterase [Sphingobium sp.]MBP6112304.1 acyl-CoA thioesterase [Sphingobium sp.]MBP8671659.1 acyl-CoA thioesterase [Sphingobium sp.]MBP9158638.1 acyl-CoA thioesterase [Sphingobium sp.]MCC6483146.1 acyl-CoA thioesterase [Sphingomonadaceae bacterium]
MAKPEPWRLQAENYPISKAIPSRFADLDPLGHINNVAMAGIFETARIHFHHLLGRHPADMGVRWLVAAVDLRYVAEAHFPYEVTVGSGIGHIGNSSWTLYSGAFQQGECVATCDTVMVMQGPKGARIIDQQIRDVMEANRARSAIFAAE